MNLVISDPIISESYAWKQRFICHLFLLIITYYPTIKVSLMGPSWGYVVRVRKVELYNEDKLAKRKIKNRTLWKAFHTFTEWLTELRGTRLKTCWRNKAGYTATEVVCGWAGAVMKKVNPSIWAGAVTQKPPVTPKKLTKAKCDLSVTDGRTDR